MATKELKARVKHAYLSAAEWSKANPILLIGEIGVDSNANILKIGNGKSNWSSLPFMSAKEAYLDWGGKNFSGTYGCIDAAMVPDLGANRLAFGNAAGIKVEYSTDSGSTWVDYGLTDTQKVGLFGNGTSVNIGKATTSTITTKCMLRVTIDSNAFGVYTALNKFVIYVSTNGSKGCYCTIDASLESSPTTFKTFMNKADVEGWSGYNVINIPTLVTYGNSPSSQYGLIRFTFGCTGVSSSYSGLAVSRIMGFGGVGWSTPSNMAKNGHLYSYDNAQNASFPAQVTATQFNGSLNGNASTATKAVLDNEGNPINATYVKKGTTTNLISNSNEFNFVTKAAVNYNNGAGIIYFNWRFSDGSMTNANLIKEYRFSNGSGNNLAKISAASFNGYTINASVPAGAKFTDTVYIHPSTHPASIITGLSTVATSGSYNDLSDKPTIPSLSTLPTVTLEEMKAMFTVK